MATHTVFLDHDYRELEILKLSVLFDRHFLNGSPTQVHFTENSSLVGTWIDEQGTANLSVGLDRIQFMNSDQLAFLIAHEYGHLVLKHPQKTLEIQQQYGVGSVLDEFMMPPEQKRDYSKQMREMELQADLFGAQTVLGLGRDPELGASFLLSETKSSQHPEGTLRVAKINVGKSTLVPEDFSATFNELAVELGDAEVLAALVLQKQNPFGFSDSPVKAVVEPWPKDQGTTVYAGSTLYGFEVSVLLTLAVLACALPGWWRKTSVG